MRRREGERGRLRKGGTKPEKKNREEQRKVLKGRKEKESNAGGRQGKVRVKAFGRKAEQGFLGMLGGIFLAVSVTLLPAGQDGKSETAGGSALASPETVSSERASFSAEPARQSLSGILDETLPAQAKPEEDFKLYAQSAVLMDAGTGRILYEKDGKTKRPMASTTKIMTCILALEEGSPEDLVTVSSYAASMPDVQLNIREGEQYYLKDLLYSLMLESHNDTAVAVAEHIAGSEEEFAVLMNQKARDIGCADTWFVTPNGLDGAGGPQQTPHSTTAEDLARIMSYCITQSPKREEFIELTRTASHSFADREGKRSFYCANHNAFLTMMPEALTGKTGFTGAAGYCYVGAVQDEGRTFVVSLLGCGWPPHKTYKWSDMKTLSSYALREYGWREVFESGKTFPDAAVKDGVAEKTGLVLAVPKGEQTLRVLMREGEEADIRYRYPSELEAPVAAGTPVGSADYYIEGELLKSYPICTRDNVERISYLYCLRQCVRQIFSF